MKTLLILLAFISFAAQASEYQCGRYSVKILGSRNNPEIRIQYVEGNHHFHISSTDFTSADPGINIPHALYFGSFHYPNGEMYVTAEGDSNEEGFTFALEEGMLNGASRVKAAMVFWSDWTESDKPEIERLNCTKI